MQPTINILNLNHCTPQPLLRKARCPYTPPQIFLLSSKAAVTKATRVHIVPYCIWLYRISCVPLNHKRTIYDTERGNKDENFGKKRDTY